MGSSQPAGKVHEAVVCSLRDRISRFLAGDQVVPFSFEDAVKDLKEKRLSYTGEEIQQPHAVSCEQITQGLPPPGHGGSIPLLPFLKGRTRYLMGKSAGIPPCGKRQIFGASHCTGTYCQR